MHRGTEVSDQEALLAKLGRHKMGREEMRYGWPLLVSLALMAGCASNNAGTQRPYTKQETSQMTLCTGLSDTAMHIATKKLQGASRSELEQFYRPKQFSQLNLAAVEKVYAADFTSAWDYTVSFFNECAQNMASVPASRVNLAAYCMQSGLIADFAYSFRSSGAPRESAYAYFAKFPRETTQEIVDRVYAGSLSRAETKLDEWNTCMSRITADS